MQGSAGWSQDQPASWPWFPAPTRQHLRAQFKEILDAAVLVPDGLGFVRAQLCLHLGPDTLARIKG